MYLKFNFEIPIRRRERKKNEKLQWKKLKKSTMIFAIRLVGRGSDFVSVIEIDVLI